MTGWYWVGKWVSKQLFLMDGYQQCNNFMLTSVDLFCEGPGFASQGSFVIPKWTRGTLIEGARLSTVALVGGG